MTHKIEGTTVDGVRVDCALSDGHTVPCRPAGPYEGMVVIVLSKTRAKHLRAFLNRYEYRERWSRQGNENNRRAARDVLQQITRELLRR